MQPPRGEWVAVGAFSLAQAIGVTLPGTLSSFHVPFRLARGGQGVWDMVSGCVTFVLTRLQFRYLCRSQFWRRELQQQIRSRLWFTSTGLNYGEPFAFTIVKFSCWGHAWMLLRIPSCPPIPDYYASRPELFALASGLRPIRFAWADADDDS